MKKLAILTAAMSLLSNTHQSFKEQAIIGNPFIPKNRAERRKKQKRF